MRTSGAGTVAILIASVLVVFVYVCAAALPFEPRTTLGLSFSFQTSRVTSVSARARADGIAVGDRVLDIRGVPEPSTGILHNYLVQFAWPGETARIATGHGIVTIAAQTTGPLPNFPILSYETSTIVLIAFATLLCVRRPGIMSLAFWLYALGIEVPQRLFPLLQSLPAPVGLVIYLLIFGYVAFAFVVPLVPFVLRFPTGIVDPRYRWADVTAWIVFACSLCAGAVCAALYFDGLVTRDEVNLAVIVFTSPVLVLAAFILLRKCLRQAPIERSQTAWAVAGFGGSIVASLVYNVAESLRSTPAEQALLTLSSLFPLLAIYPILRFRLFDLGFVVNRAALYSILTLAAIGTLAGVNWFAQHFVTDRLAFVFQPVAAIIIGLGYMRVRAWTQLALERTIFRARFAADEHLTATINGFSLVDRPESLDESLTIEAAKVLSLSSAAVFRVQGDTIVRAASVGWAEGTLDALRRDDSLVRRLLTDSPAIALRSAYWEAGALPAAPADPAVAIALVHGSTFVGVAFYGRHSNATEIDPEEMALLRSLCDAAAAAYEKAELRSKMARLENRNAALEDRLISLWPGRAELEAP